MFKGNSYFTLIGIILTGLVLIINIFMYQKLKNKNYNSELKRILTPKKIKVIEDYNKQLKSIDKLELIILKETSNHVKAIVKDNLKIKNDYITDKYFVLDFSPVMNILQNNEDAYEELIFSRFYKFAFQCYKNDKHILTLVPDLAKKIVYIFDGKKCESFPISTMNEYKLMQSYFRILHDNCKDLE